MSDYPSISKLKRPNKWLTERLDILGDKGNDEKTRLWVSTSLGLFGLIGSAITVPVVPPLGILSLLGGLVTLSGCMFTDFGVTGKLRLYALTMSDISRLNDKITKHRGQEENDREKNGSLTESTVDSLGRPVRTNETKTSLEVAAEYLSPEEAFEAVFVEENRKAIAFYLESISPEIKDTGFESYEERFDAYRLMITELFYDLDKQESDYYDILDSISSQLSPVTREIYPHSPHSLPQSRRLSKTNDLLQQEIESPPVAHHLVRNTHSNYQSPSSNPVVQGLASNYQQGFLPSRTGYQIFQDLVDSTCCYVAGGQQSGKTLLLAETTKRKAEEGILVFYVNWFAQALDKDGRWDHVPDSRKVEVDISLLDQKSLCQIINETLNLLRTFQQMVFMQRIDCILVWDEIELSADKSGERSKLTIPVLQLLSDLIGRLTGVGVKSGGAIHVLSPGYAASSFFPCVNARAKKMIPIICSVNKGKFLKTRNGKKITFNKGVVQQMANNFKSAVTVEVPTDVSATETERIFQFEEQWCDLGSAADLPPVRANPLGSIPSGQQQASLAQKKMPNSKMDNIARELEESGCTDLWSFSLSLDLATTENRKRFINILSTYLECFNPEIGSKFSRYKGQAFIKEDGAVSYPSREYKELATIQLTNSKCCLCQKQAKNIEIHRTVYLGEEDDPGVNMFPLCPSCHDDAHSPETWEEDSKNIWNSYQVEGFTKRLKLGLNYLTQNT
ncbi:hypothetical protein [Moorena sp. SIO3I8]|uniref:hypothetical protein n=1 Tax=Moorena sp. SIO3I8 TaxID=2607833 RepID=UPI0013C11D0B|nr:hypothetical protein [Moorena sp. SIO3I8]NEO08431.1 hypothetical protein [Moorena sp. SIO3I8]